MFNPGGEFSHFLGPQTTTERGTESFDELSTPEVSAEGKGDLSTIQGILRERLRGGGLPLGYEAAQIRNINAGAAGARQRIANLAASRGLSGQQVAGLATPIETNVANQIANLQAELPLKARALEGEDINTLSNLLSTFFRGERRTGRREKFGERISPADAQALFAFLRTQAPLEPIFFNEEG